MPFRCFCFFGAVASTAGATTPAHLILPATTLGLAVAGTIARFTRLAMLEVLRQSCLRTARAKGAPRWRQVAWNALPNAAIPTVTVIGFQLGWLIGGSVVIETVFAWRGAGRPDFRDFGVKRRVAGIDPVAGNG